MLGFVSFSCPTEHTDGELIEQHACLNERKNVAGFFWTVPDCRRQNI